MQANSANVDEDTRILNPRRLYGIKLFLAHIVWWGGTVFFLAAFVLLGIPEIQKARSGKPEITLTRNSRGEIVIASVQDNSPITPGDVLIEINHIPVQKGMSVYQARRLWMGKIGEPIELKLRAANGSIYTVTVIRSPKLFNVLQKFGWTQATYDTVILLLDITFIVVTVGIGFILAKRKSEDWLALYASLTLILMAVNQSQLLQQAALGLPLWHFVLFGPPLAMVHSSLYIFPDGRLFARWTIIPIAIVVAYFILRMMLQWSGLTIQIDLLFYLFECGLLYYRYRHTTSPIERVQIKWVLWGFGLAIAGVFIPMLVQNYIFPLFPNIEEAQMLWWVIFWQPIHKLSVAIPAITLVIAMLRTRLWQVDYFISRTVAYGIVLFFISAMLVIILLIFSKVMVAFTPAFNYWLIAFLVLPLLLYLFRPVRRNIQKWVDQKFFGIRVPYLGGHPQLPRLEFECPAFSNCSQLSLIGHGGMSEVYSALYGGEKQKVAIKILARNLPNHLDYTTRFLREASLLKSFDHPNIIRIFEYGEIENVPYMVMEYIEGGDLGQYLLQHTVLTWQQAEPILAGIASALDYIHARKVIHRDIKPQNIMLQRTSNGQIRPVLMDFGIAKRLYGTLLPTPADLLGTIHYMSPEQIQADADTDSASDLYAFGVMTYQLLTGELPFRQKNAGAVLLAHINQPPPNACNVNPALPSLAGFVIQRAMAKQPSERFESAGAFFDALNQAMHTAPAKALQGRH